MRSQCSSGTISIGFHWKGYCVFSDHCAGVHSNTGVQLPEQFLHWLSFFEVKKGANSPSEQPEPLSRQVSLFHDMLKSSPPFWAQISSSPKSRTQPMLAGVCPTEHCGVPVSSRVGGTTQDERQEARGFAICAAQLFNGLRTSLSEQDPPKFKQSCS